jgi:hypothetical protein
MAITEHTRVQRNWEQASELCEIAVQQKPTGDPVPPESGRVPGQLDIHAAVVRRPFGNFVSEQLDFVNLLAPLISLFLQNAVTARSWCGEQRI